MLKSTIPLDMQITCGLKNYFEDYIVLVSCLWGPVTSNGVDLLTEI